MDCPSFFQIFELINNWIKTKIVNYLFFNVNINTFQIINIKHVPLIEQYHLYHNLGYVKIKYWIWIIFLATDNFLFTTFNK